MKAAATDSDVCVATFYRFVPLEDLEGLREGIEAQAAALGLRGTVLIAAEGINGTLTGPRRGLDALLIALRAEAPFAGLRARYSSAEPGNPVFDRLKVRIKAEIVALGQPGVDPSRRTGEHVDAERWHALLDDPEVLVIDTRNRYEIDVGSFPGAVDPGTDSFREFPEFVDRALDPARHRRVAMFCTGGIRCEKASAYLLERGFEMVYQLGGGILNYLETVPADRNRWQGECFVFDQRVTVTPALTEGAYRQCHACRHPLTAADLASPDFLPGRSCPYCADAAARAEASAPEAPPAD